MAYDEAYIFTAAIRTVAEIKEKDSRCRWSPGWVTGISIEIEVFTVSCIFLGAQIAFVRVQITCAIVVGLFGISLFPAF